MPASAPTPDEIRAQQKASWNAFSPGWRKWDEFNREFLRPMGEAIIAALALRPDDHVLDVATGTGEPGLTIAGRVPRGRVVGTDLADQMVEIARENARRRGIGHYHAQTADVSALPFPEASFQAVSCRMGFMFFPDMPRAAREIARVLAPGGRLAASVWTVGDQNPWVATLMGIIARRFNLPPPPPGAPGMFRCGAPGVMSQLFRDAGLENVAEQDIPGQIRFASADEYWIMMNEVAAPVVAALAKTDDAGRAEIKRELFAAFGNSAGPLTLGYGARVISAAKPC
ncbi:MAG TPA: methyltransferase domain-containing protein [Opitutaceae bacterium]|jgi:SAM-dependent methyltransferase|nr:methyltransferase domain-containing protein [Opitutaceae bacterium]